MCFQKRHKNLILGIYPNVPGQSQLNQSNLSYFLYYLQTRPHKLNKSVHYLLLLTLKFNRQKSDSFHLITLKIINGVIDQNKQHLNLYIIHLYKIIKELLFICLELQESTISTPDTLPTIDNPLLPSLMNTFMLINSHYDGSLNIDEEFAAVLKEIVELLTSNISTNTPSTPQSISYYALIGIQSLLNAPWVLNNRLGEDLLNFIIPVILKVLMELNSEKQIKYPIDLQDLQLDPLSTLIMTTLSQFISKFSTSHIDKLNLPVFTYLESKKDKYPYIIQIFFLNLAKHASYQVRTIFLSTILDRYKISVKNKDYTTVYQLLNIINQWFLLNENQHVAIPMLELVQCVTVLLGQDSIFKHSGSKIKNGNILNLVELDRLHPLYDTIPILIETIGTLLVNPFHAMYIHSTIKWLTATWYSLLLINCKVQSMTPMAYIFHKCFKYASHYLEIQTTWTYDVPHPKQVLCPELFHGFLCYSSFDLILFYSQLLQMEWKAHLPVEAMLTRHGLHDLAKNFIYMKLQSEETQVILPEELIAIRHCFIGLLHYQTKYEHRYECIQMIVLIIDTQSHALTKISVESYKTSLMALQVTLLAILYSICEHLELIELRHVVVQVICINLEAK